jgi:hypothetical protein
MPRVVTAVSVIGVFSGLLAGLLVGPPLWAATKPASGSASKPANQSAVKAASNKPKYYFQVTETKSVDETVDEATRNAAKEILAADLAARPEFTSDLGVASGDESALPDELKRRKLQGFNVTLKIESLSREPKPPRPGGRLKQLAVNIKLSVFGTTIPEAKLAFGGEGEAGVEAEVVERRIEEEAATLIKDAMVQAVKQAVDQAVAKLSLPKSKPYNESKKRRP